MITSESSHPNKFSNHSQTSVSISQLSTPPLNGSDSLFRSECIAWLKALSAEERRAILIFKLPHLVHSYQCLQQKFMHWTQRRNKQNGEFWKSSKVMPEPFRVFLQALVFLTDEDYLDSIGFSQLYVKKPEKIVDIIYKIQQISQLQTKKEALDKANQEQNLSQLSHWVQNVAEEIGAQLVSKLQSKPKKMISPKLKQKDFIKYWQNLNENQRIGFLRLDSDEKILLESKLKEYGLVERAEENEYQIYEVLQKLKEDACERIFRQLPNKNNLCEYFYCEILYDKWKQLHYKSTSPKSSKKKYQKMRRPKSVGAMSNETNETDIHEKKLEFNIEEIASSKLEKDIIDYSDRISQCANSYFERRVLAFQRLKYLLEAYEIKIKLYGSCACGIAVENSDLDVAVDESILGMFGDVQTVQKQVNKALQTIQQIIKMSGFVTQIKLINSAYIPIIKFIINTQSPFICQNPVLYSHLNRPVKNGGSVQVDLTIQTKNSPHTHQHHIPINSVVHLGLKSTSQIREWLQTYSTLRPILLIFKNLLTLKKLHETYNEGLNTYTLVVMLVAVMSEKQLKNEKRLNVVMQKILKFYGWEFEEDKTGIDIRNESVLYEKEKDNRSLKSAELQVKDPLNNGKIMTKNCYRFPQIRDLFRNLYNMCIIRIQTKVQEKCSVWNPKEKKMNSHELSKWVLDELAENQFQIMFS